MRKFSMFAAVAATTLLVVGCGTDDVDSESETIADTSARPSSTASELAERPETSAPSGGPTLSLIHI